MFSTWPTHGCYSTFTNCALLDSLRVTHQNFYWALIIVCSGQKYFTEGKFFVFLSRKLARIVIAMATIQTTGLLRNRSSPIQTAVPIATAAEMLDSTTNQIYTPARGHTHPQVKGRFRRLQRQGVEERTTYQMTEKMSNIPVTPVVQIWKSPGRYKYTNVIIE